MPVRDWEIWNEPNLAVYWTQQPFMRPYARLLNAAYAAIKGADGGATVVMAGLANFSWRDLARLYRSAGVRLRFDAAAAHPFSGRPSNAVKIVRLNREVLDRHGAARKPLWLTELTWSSAKGRKTPITKDWETTEAGQAQRLRQAYTLFVKARRSLRLQRIYWYTWVTSDRDSVNSFDYSGLRTLLPDGDGDRQARRPPPSGTSCAATARAEPGAAARARAAGGRRRPAGSRRSSAARSSRAACAPTARAGRAGTNSGARAAPPRSRYGLGRARRVPAPQLAPSPPGAGSARPARAAALERRRAASCRTAAGRGLRRGLCSSASPFWAAIAIGSKSAPIGGE